MHSVAHFAMWLCVSFSVGAVVLALVLTSCACRTRQHNGEIEVLNWNMPCILSLCGIMWAMGALALSHL
jgi:hypothetical protein